MKSTRYYDRNSAVLARAFRVLANLLKPGGRLVVSLRLGNDEKENKERGFHSVSGTELVALARGLALQEIGASIRPDRSRRYLQWETRAFLLQDD